MDVGEILHYYSGAPLVLRRANTLEGPAHDAVLGPDLAAEQFPQLVFEADYWQAARSTGRLYACWLHCQPQLLICGF